MSESKQNLSSNFGTKEEAFEFLVQQSQNKALKEQWKKELDQLPDAPPEEKGKVKTLFNRRALALAASFILLLGSFYWFTNQNDSLQDMGYSMIEDTNFILESDSATRGLYDNLESQMAIDLQKEINVALEKQDYEAALGLYLTKEKKSQLSIDDKFYYSLSIARLKDGDHHKAIRLLEDVIKTEDRYYNEALWLQALLYITINEPNQSKIILNKLINKSNYQITNTKALLEKMAN